MMPAPRTTVLVVSAGLVKTEKVRERSCIVVGALLSVGGDMTGVWCLEFCSLERDGDDEVGEKRRKELGMHLLYSF